METTTVKTEVTTASLTSDEVKSILINHVKKETGNKNVEYETEDIELNQVKKGMSATITLKNPKLETSAH